MADGEVKAAARTFKEKVAVALTRKKAAAREVAPKLNAEKSDARADLHFLCTLYESFKQHEKCRRSPLGM